MAPQVISSPHLLLVEGEDERRFFLGALNSWNPTYSVEIIRVGRTNLPTRLDAVSKMPGFESIQWLGVAQDADEDSSAAFDRICTALGRVSLSVPGAPWVPTGSNPVVVALVWPDGTSQGDLETLLLECVEHDDPSRARCVGTYFECLTAAGQLLPRQLAKAKVHAYLASLTRPDLRLGEAAEAQLLPIQGSTLNRLRALIPTATAH